MHWSPTRKYLLILFLCLCGAPLIAFANYIFLNNAHEFDKIDDLVRLQLQEGALFYPAIHQLTYPYKLSLLKRLQPTVVALGSSRVQQMRARYFAAPFANLGGAMLNLKEGHQVLREMAAGPNKPQVVLMGLDPWMFSRGADQAFAGDYNATGTDIRPDMLFQPVKWLFQRKLPLHYYWQTLWGHKQQLFPALGVFASVHLEGFYTDGSFYHLGRVIGSYKAKDLLRFANTLDDIRKGGWVFKPDASIRPERWEEFVSLVNLARQENFQLITFIPPLPAKVIDAIAEQGDKFAYIDQVRKKIPEVSPRHYDFFDPRSFGSGDCEFLDGLHGGEITDLRIVTVIADDPASGLASYLRREEIAACIRRYQGKAMTPPPFYPRPYTEVDFMDLGCKKD